MTVAELIEKLEAMPWDAQVKMSETDMCAKEPVSVDEEIIGTCECCYYESIPVKTYTSQREYEFLHNLPAAPQRLCLICASSQLGTIVEWPSRQANGVVDLARSLGWIANHILRSVKPQ